jgi:hypothetical protein
MYPRRLVEPSRTFCGKQDEQSKLQSLPIVWLPRINTSNSLSPEVIGFSGAATRKSMSTWNLREKKTEKFHHATTG